VASANSLHRILNAKPLNLLNWFCRLTLPLSPRRFRFEGGSIIAMMARSSELTLDDAKNLYAKFADKDGDDAVRVMAQIALWGNRQDEVGYGAHRWPTYLGARPGTPHVSEAHPESTQQS